MDSVGCLCPQTRMCFVDRSALKHSLAKYEQIAQDSIMTCKGVSQAMLIMLDIACK